MMHSRPCSSFVTGRLFEQVDAASLAFFRICFGVIMLVECGRFYRHDWIERYYISPDFLFSYYGFEWITPLPGNGMYWLFGALALLSLCVTIGLFYRLAIVLLWLGFTYVFLLDQARYLNHFYLVSLMLFLLSWVPAHRIWSVDAWRKGGRDGTTVGLWSVWLLRGQMEVMLIFAGLVKLNPDWLRLEPLGMWLARRAEAPLIGPWLEQDWMVAVAAYGAIAVHLVGAPLLLWRRTRLPIILAYCGFHLSNHFMFTIGIFPWLTMAATLLFLDPDWPRQVLHGLRRRMGLTPAPYRPSLPGPTPGPALRRVVLGGMVVWFAVQVLLPLRHLLYEGNPSWTEEGHTFAWMMKLRDKKADIEFRVFDPPTRREWRVEPNDFLFPHQARKVGTRPDLIVQLAHHIERVWERELGVSDVEVRVRSCVSLNGRPAALLIDPQRDLTQVKRSLRQADWILPLRVPFERPPQRSRRYDLSC
ncbi:hypothetical protein OJHNALOF_01683 [Oceanimonas sp. MB9]|nr:hypothetical protein [Oceanimonas sp. MB9]